jgi:hypothetical protein
VVAAAVVGFLSGQACTSPQDHFPLWSVAAAQPQPPALAARSIQLGYLPQAADPAVGSTGRLVAQAAAVGLMAVLEPQTSATLAATEAAAALTSAGAEAAQERPAATEPQATLAGQEAQAQRRPKPALL